MSIRIVIIFDKFKWLFNNNWFHIDPFSTILQYFPVNKVLQNFPLNKIHNQKRFSLRISAQIGFTEIK